LEFRKIIDEESRIGAKWATINSLRHDGWNGNWWLKRGTYANKNRGTMLKS
jgi:hypothetical protein